MAFAEVPRYPRDWGVMGKFNTPEERQEEINRMLWERDRRGSHYPVSPPPIFMDEIPRTMEWNYERDGYNPLEGFGPIGPYRPEIDKSEVVPLEDVFRSLFSIAGTGDVEKEDYDNLQRQYQKEYDDYMNPKGLDPFAPPIDLAGGPELFPIKKDVPGQVRGVIRGVQGLDRNDLSKPYGGIKKAALDSLYGQLFEIATGTGNPVGDSVPIAPYKTRNGIEYLPYPYGPKQA